MGDDGAAGRVYAAAAGLGDTPSSGGADGATTAASGGGSGMRAVAAATTPVQLLPDTTAVVMNIAGIGSLLAMVDVDALVAKYRPFYDQGATLMTASFGANLLDPAQWSVIGVDAKGPMGAALIDVRSATFVAYARISDPGRLRDFIDRVAGPGRLLPVFEDRGLVLRMDQDASSALVLRDGFVFLVVTDRPNAASTDMARLLATIDPARGLTASARYQQAIAGGAPAPGLTAYVDVWAALEDERDSLASPRSEPSWAEQELETAKANGAAPAVVDGLRQQVDVEHEWERKNRERRARALELARRWLGEMSPVVFEFTASASGVLGTIRAKMSERAPLRAALRNAAEVVPVISARDAAMQGFGDPILAALLVIGTSASFDEAIEPSQPYWSFTDVSPEQIDKVPRSAAYKAKIREWQALTAKIRKRNQAKERTQAQQAVNVARSLGVMAGNLREQPDGVVLAGGQMFGKGGLTRAIELMTDYVATPSSHDEALHDLISARGKLESEMEEIRVREVAAALKVSTPR